MQIKSLVQTFARESGRVAVIEEVARHRLRIFCSFCNSLLIAKQGEQRIWHFAHANQSDCNGAIESVLIWLRNKSSNRPSA